jgi:hypothetical protein
VNVWPFVVNLEAGQMMDSRKDTIPSKSRQMRVGVAPRDEHPDVASVVVVPFDGKAMGDVFSSQANRSGQMGGTELSQTDEADPSHRPSRNKVGSERAW